MDASPPLVPLIRPVAATDAHETATSPSAHRLIPVVLYAAHLERDEIEHPAHTGILWLQIGPADGLKLVAAIRGVLAPSTT